MHGLGLLQCMMPGGCCHRVQSSGPLQPYVCRMLSCLSPTALCLLLLPSFGAAGGARRRLISCLAALPCAYCEWFWAGTWSFGVSSSYLEAEELLALPAVVALRLDDLAAYLAGVGVPGGRRASVGGPC